MPFKYTKEQSVKALQVVLQKDGGNPTISENMCRSIWKKLGRKDKKRVISRYEEILKKRNE